MTTLCYWLVRPFFFGLSVRRHVVPLFFFARQTRSAHSLGVGGKNFRIARRLNCSIGGKVVSIAPTSQECYLTSRPLLQTQLGAQAVQGKIKKACTSSHHKTKSQQKQRKNTNFTFNQNPKK